jgi:hypothetical protein
MRRRVGSGSMWLALGSSLTLLWACTAKLEGGRGSGQDDLPYGGSAGSTGAGSGVPVITRVARLTHGQYDNTVSALLGVTERPAASFAPDAQDGYSFDNSINLRVDGRLGPQYRAAAEELAEKAAADATFVGRFVSCTAGSAGCSDLLIAELGQRAFRRPLTDLEKTRFAALFARGSELVASGDPFRDGVRLVVEALLQSPQFLYRSELSNTPGPNGLIPVSSWEMASRLSYFLLGSMPDAQLFALAQANQLSTPAEITAAAERLLGDPRAQASVEAFHAQAFRFSKFKKVSPDKAVYPLAPTDMALKVEEAARLFVNDVVFQSRGGLAELLSAPYAFADASLAPIYGKTVTGAGFQKVTFDAGERAGFMMQAGFLASNAYAIRTDPIHRGLFIQRDLLCRTIPDPPPGASMTPLPPTSDLIKTTRQQVTVLTAGPDCVGCHKLINEPGFAFESFDAIGQLRSQDNMAPVDTSGSTNIDGSEVSFTSAVQLTQALAQSAEARACYVSKWLEYAFGRAKSELDAADRDALASSAQPTLAVVKQVAATQGFRFRAPNPLD